MKVISRRSAIAAGYYRYYTGKPCIYGHYSERYVKSHTCVECSALVRKRNKAENPLYFTHRAMISRCYNEEHHSYENYGGRGIYVCERWLDPVHGYDNFLEDLGPRPAGCTLDRIDYNGPYCPENCRWADKITQELNKRWTKIKPEYVPEIFRMFDEGLKDSAIAKKFNCQQGSILNLKRNRERYREAGFVIHSEKAA